MKIVVVEDEEYVLNGLIRLIAKLEGSYHVIGKAENGNDGYSLIHELKPDLVITDIKMPFMSGIEMLAKLHEQGYRHKAIILTGYSEFEYAKKALQLGVRDYLEKPITADDLKAVLKKIEQEFAFEQLGVLPNRPLGEQIEQLIRQTVLREDLDPELLSNLLQQTKGFLPHCPFQLLQFYSGTEFQEMERFLKDWESNRDALGPKLVFSLPTDRSVYLLLQTGRDPCTPDNRFGEQIRDMINWFPSIVVSRTEIVSLSELKSGISRLMQLRRWSISNLQSPVLSEEAVAAAEVHPFQYPGYFDNRIALVVAESNWEEIHQVFADWLTFISEKCYPPQQIINATVQLVTTLLKHLSSLPGYDHLAAEHCKWLDAIWNVQTKFELVETMKSIADQTSRFQRKNLYSLHVMKALQFIHAQYQNGIQLEEIADTLHIRPEYLSSLFTKEVGQTYSSYLKEYRIQKAKELLTRSKLKISEIAQKVGYPDAKYFSRVFREVTGLTPGEYQRLNSAFRVQNDLNFTHHY